MPRAVPSLSVETVLAIYTAAEVDSEIERLKAEIQNLYHTTSGGGKSGGRDLGSLRSDLESFGQAKRILNGNGGIVTTQADFSTGPDASHVPGAGWRYDTGSGI